MEPVTCIVVKTCDQIWVLCPKEVAYQKLSVKLLRDMYEMNVMWERFEDIRSILPRPIPAW